MNFIDRFMGKWEQWMQKAKPLTGKADQVFKKASDKLIFAWKYVMKFKKIFLAVPVGTMAVILALQNLIKLPPIVGLDLQSNGDFTIQIIREVAAIGPMAITAVCILLMFCSKRTLTPWVVSVMSLLLPLLILITNTFPA